MKHQATIRVVLIDGNAADAQMIGGLLTATKDYRFELQTFKTLQAGLIGTRARRADVVLLDLSLPDSQGLPALSKVVAATSGVPIVVLAGADVTAAIEERIKVGGRVFLRKAQLSSTVLIDAILEQTGRTRSGESDSGRTAQPNSKSIPNVSVLVVEDNYGDLALIRLMLATEKSAHFEIIHASKLGAALALMHRGADIMLLDLSLPDSDGLPTLRTVRERDPNIPIIVLTGSEDRQKAVESLANGAQDYLVKDKVDGYLLARTILRRVNLGRTAKKDDSQKVTSA